MTNKEIINEIEEVVNKKHTIFNSMGVVNGLAGVSLFYYYYNRFGNIKNNNIELFLENAIDGL